GSRGDAEARRKKRIRAETAERVFRRRRPSFVGPGAKPKARHERRLRRKSEFSAASARIKFSASPRLRVKSIMAQPPPHGAAPVGSAARLPRPRAKSR